MIERVLDRITPYIGIVLFMAAIFIVHHELKLHTIGQIIAGLGQMPLSIILLGILLTGINYLFLSGYDFLALKYLGKTVRLQNVILASLISFSISNNTGQALISGSSMRYRFYSMWGLSGMDIIKFSLFISLMYVLGATTLFSITTLTLPRLAGPGLSLAAPSLKVSRIAASPSGDPLPECLMFCAILPLSARTIINFIS